MSTEEFKEAPIISQIFDLVRKQIRKDKEGITVELTSYLKGKTKLRQQDSTTLLLFEKDTSWEGRLC